MTEGLVTSVHMKPPFLTLDQQRDDVRPIAEGWKAASEGQARSAAVRTAAGKLGAD